MGALMAAHRTRNRPEEVIDWLRTEPELDELVEAYPDHWRRVQAALDKIIDRNDPEAIKKYLSEVANPGAALPGRARPKRELLAEEIRRQMTLQALRQATLAATNQGKTGRVRFGLLNGYVSQKMLFRRALERKPASATVFRLVWPLLRQRRLLMPLVQPKGIYCFYTKKLIRKLAAMIGERTCLEIAAGDGTLSRFLAASGVAVTATDDYSWQSRVEYPADVLCEDARTALRKHAPQVVVCSWPPPGNTFERIVFTTPSVDLYVVITSREEHAAGDWNSYRSQNAFTMTEEIRLSRLVLPPEIDPLVLVFRRKSDAGT
jgi:hypothetical protein